MTDRDVVRIARDILTAEELEVWIAKYATGLGRRAGSLALGITEDAFRYRLQRAHAKMLSHTSGAAA